MDNASSEILHWICSQMDPYDVKSFRLLNKRCATIGLEYLCPIVSFTLVPSSWERLKQICEHQVLSGKVHTVVFMPLLLPNPSSLRPEARILLEKEQRWDWYIAEHKRAENVATKTQAVNRIASWLSQLPRLRTFALPRCTPVRNFPFKLEMADVQRADLIYDISGNKFAFRLLTSVLAEEIPLDRLELWFDGQEAIGALSPDSDYPWKDLLVNVRHLSWDFPRLTRDLDVAIDLEPMLIAVQNLQTIKVGLFGSISQDIRGFYCPSLARIIRNHYFNSLEELHFEKLRIYEATFMSFLDRHSVSLKRVFLHSIDIINCNMVPLFAKLRELDLDEVVIDGTWRIRIGSGGRRHASFSMGSMIPKSRNVPTIGQLICGVIQDRWRHVDEHFNSVPGNHSVEDKDSLQLRLLKILVRWAELPDSSFPAEFTTNDGYIFFKQDLLLEKVARYEKVLHEHAKILGLNERRFDTYCCYSQWSSMHGHRVRSS